MDISDHLTKAITVWYRDDTYYPEVVAKYLARFLGTDDVKDPRIVAELERFETGIGKVIRRLISESGGDDAVVWQTLDVEPEPGDKIEVRGTMVYEGKPVFSISSSLVLTHWKKQ